MAREEGSVNAQREAWLTINGANGDTVECLIDTGFNGSLMLPRETVDRLNLTILGRVPIIAAGGAKSIADVAELEIRWLDARRPVEVIISDGDDSLIGTELFASARLVIDYIAHTATISDEVS